MIDRIRSLSLRVKLLLLILGMGCISLLLFFTLWNNIAFAWSVAKYLPCFSFDEEAFVGELRQDAQNYTVPEYNDGKNGKNTMEGFFAPADKYTGIYIYGSDDGLYRASKYPEILNSFIIGTVLERGASLIDIYGKPGYEPEFYTLEFQNGPADVLIQNYRYAAFVYPYLIVIVCLCVGIFLFSILTYINRRMKDILCLKQEILLMASGDLSHPVPFCGQDEIGTLSTELDCLRQTLSEQIAKEAESRQANQDLITAMSHDLRTPLTILKGYLEVLKLKQTHASELSETYLERCLKKADDIREMTDRMFEYALVFGEQEDFSPTELPASFLCQCIRENMDFLALAGFETKKTPDASDVLLPCGKGSLADTVFTGDETMLKRIFNNLFSNILKYGEKSVPVTVSLQVAKDANPVTAASNELFLEISLLNAVKEDRKDIAGNGIGLKSVLKMLTLHHGTLTQEKTDGMYRIRLCFPLSLPQIKEG